MSTLRELLPPEWHIEHEPETMVNLQGDLVVDGKMQEWAGDCYTCDFVACDTSCKRICFESKPSEKKLDAPSRQKCRKLRDRALARVVAIVDHDERLAYYDFGPVGSPPSQECWYNSHEELRAALGIMKRME